jgi:hypothetical protein
MPFDHSDLFAREVRYSTCCRFQEHVKTYYYRLVYKVFDLLP